MRYFAVILSLSVYGWCGEGVPAIRENACSNASVCHTINFIVFTPGRLPSKGNIQTKEDYLTVNKKVVFCFYLGIDDKTENPCKEG